eukprot:tig00000114_g6077.t1
MCTPTYFTCCLTFGIFAYVMHDDDFRRNTFYFCKLLRDISSEHRKGDEYDWIELLPRKSELVLWRDKCIVGSLKSDNMATVRNANEIDPAKLAFEIDATGRIKAKYDGLQGLMIAVDGQTNPAADEFLKLLEALDAKFCEFVQQKPGQAQDDGGQAQDIPVVDMSNYLITERATSAPATWCRPRQIDTAYAIPEGKFGLKWPHAELAFRPYDNEASFEPT